MALGLSQGHRRSLPDGRVARGAAGHPAGSPEPPAGGQRDGAIRSDVGRPAAQPHGRVPAGGGGASSLWPAEPPPPSREPRPVPGARGGGLGPAATASRPGGLAVPVLRAGLAVPRASRCGGRTAGSCPCGGPLGCVAVTGHPSVRACSVGEPGAPSSASGEGQRSQGRQSVPSCLGPDVGLH